MGEINLDADTGDIIKTIQASVETKILDVKEDQYTTRNVAFAPRRELVPTMEIASLSGIVDYIKEEVDGVITPRTFIQVVSPTEVAVRQPISSAIERRFTPVRATADCPSIHFDSFIDRERMSIQIQSKFVDTIARAELLTSLGNIVADEEIIQEDDGVSQTVTVQKGVNRNMLTLKNPYILQPFRTFTEIDQPASPFILRIKEQDREIYAALYEADGGAWRNEARKSIKEFLDASFKGALGEDPLPVVIA